MIANNQNIIYNDIIKIKKRVLMSGNEIKNNNIFNENDSLDINELASLNEDISPEFIEQLQNKVAQDALGFAKETSSEVENADLFEEVDDKTDSNETKIEHEPHQKTPSLSIDESIDDNFIKKYKAKLNKQNQIAKQEQIDAKKNQDANTTNIEPVKQSPEKANIEQVSSGNIIEKPIKKEQIEYNDSLDYLDENVKYTKYVIYIDPENTDFIDSLTVKERKNLINKILREQDDIAITKKRFNILQTVIKHVIVSIITIAISIPIIYLTINTSLEASVNNYRRSQTLFKTLYKEQGKIKKS
jgi:hypothetical protein